MGAQPGTGKRAMAANSNALSIKGGRNRLMVASIVPEEGIGLASQWSDVQTQLDVMLATHGMWRENIVKLCIFVSRRRFRNFIRKRLREFFNGEMPATSLIYQPPANGSTLALEAIAIRGPNVQLFKLGEHLTVVNDKDARWAYVAGIEPSRAKLDTYKQALDCFDQMQRHLLKTGFHFNHVIRTWIYERDIVKCEKNASGRQQQRYQILNDARREFYTKGNEGRPFAFYHDLPPASTGIGISEGTFVMECLALDVPKGVIEVTPLKNPEQIDAHSYSPEVLKRGAAAIKAAPLFSRGISVSKDYRMLLISGTASIKGQKSVCIGDPAGQTKTTLDNISLVLSQAGASLQNVQQARIYIKSSSDPNELSARIEAVKKVVESMLPDVPTLYLIADVCRDELLVEIEALSFVGIKSAKRTGATSGRIRKTG